MLIEESWIQSVGRFNEPHKPFGLVLAPSIVQANCRSDTPTSKLQSLKGPSITQDTNLRGSNCASCLTGTLWAAASASAPSSAKSNSAKNQKTFPQKSVLIPPRRSRLPIMAVVAPIMILSAGKEWGARKVLIKSLPLQSSHVPSQPAAATSGRFAGVLASSPCRWATRSPRPALPERCAKNDRAPTSIYKEKLGPRLSHTIPPAKQNWLRKSKLESWPGCPRWARLGSPGSQSLQTRRNKQTKTWHLGTPGTRTRRARPGPPGRANANPKKRQKRKATRLGRPRWARPRCSPAKQRGGKKEAHAAGVSAALT